MSVATLPLQPAPVNRLEKQAGPKAVDVNSAAFRTVAQSLAAIAGQKHGDFRDELFEQGYVVVKSAIPRERAQKYVDKAYSFLESFNLGFDRNDPSTFDKDKLPFSHRGGLYNSYSSGHEQVAWDIRQEEGIIDAFAKIWGTRELLVSFDGINVSVPLNLEDNKNKGISKPWPHVDQSPKRQFLHCIQGIANLAPNGSLDGGLMVLRGSKNLYSECFLKFDHLKPEGGWPSADSYLHEPEMLEWMIKEKGCYWEKVCADPGDLILWDSRTVHYGSVPLSKNARVATYVCYKPAALASPETYEAKKKAFENLNNCTHDPTMFQTIPTVEPQENDPGWKVRQKPAPPVLSAVGRKLAGLDRY